VIFCSADASSDSYAAINDEGLAGKIGFRPNRSRRSYIILPFLRCPGLFSRITPEVAKTRSERSRLHRVVPPPPNVLSL
jgi:hypothetical protein